VALAPLDFGRFSHDLLIGQFAGGGETQSSGFIAAYDLATGKFDGLLQDASGKPLAINGLWALSPEMSARLIMMRQARQPQSCTSQPDRTMLRRVVGYLTASSTELTEGNDSNPVSF